MQNIPIKKKTREYVPGRINDLNPKRSQEEEDLEQEQRNISKR